MDHLVFFTDNAMLAHQNGPAHVESPDRLRTLHSRISTDFAHIPLRSGPPATASQVTLVHAPEYVAKIQGYRGQTISLDPDTTLTGGSVDAAFCAAGQAIASVAAVLSGESRRSWALVRPPGHHAERDHAMGFCVFNNIAIAAEYARQNGASRVLIIDWDVHHGNGTAHHFYERDDVLVFNTHQHPFYPGTGALQNNGDGPGEGYTVNVPLPPRSNDEDLLAAFTRILEPIATEFAPDIILVSAGFDAHEWDPLGEMFVSTEGFANLCERVRRLADTLCHGRLALILEGGYDLEALADSFAACTSVLLDEAPEPRLAAQCPEVEKARSFHATHWSCLR